MKKRLFARVEGVDFCIGFLSQTSLKPLNFCGAPNAIVHCHGVRRIVRVVVKLDLRMTFTKNFT